ncbi:MAG: DNA repair protein RecN [Proteobacteria bacterium]|nr:MAG: DNA repair protein RecN [Pseudomonadota bacterium]QKK12184.1 MAG: DNA repair protein RecN [Pseudomonadota bacterium]
MLTHLQIRDFVIVDRLELDFQSGMSVITGETGAGKSIVIDALGLVLGERADTSVISPTSEQAEVIGSFDLMLAHDAQRWLAEEELAENDECHIRRVISTQGRSKAWINGRPVTLLQLKALGDRLVDIHGQHEHQSLLQRTLQRELLDAYAGNGELRAQVATIAHSWGRVRDELDALERSDADRAARRDLLAYQIRELEELALNDGELAELEAEHGRLANAEGLLSACGRAQEMLFEADEQNIVSALNQTLHSLEPYSALHPLLQETYGLLSDCAIQVQEAVRNLRDTVSHIELDPERLNWIDERLAKISELSRKHRIKAEALPGLLENLLTEQQGLNQADSRRSELHRELEQASAAYREAALALRDSRRRSAVELAAAVSDYMQGLAMSGGQFDIALEPINEGTPSPQGWDQVEFLVSANPGQPLRPLNKVASGGELSRISLAVQVVTTRNALIPTLIFDEVDVGIGGSVAETVGALMRQLGDSRQILCITHLPQVAAQGHHHYAVSKRIDGNSTRTAIRLLADDERVQELARMMGGAEITAQTQAHAREMMERWQ